MGEVCRTLAEQFFDVDTDVETSLEIRVMPQTQTVNPPVSRAELAAFRHWKRLHSEGKPTDLSPDTWRDAMCAGWLAPDAAHALRDEIDTLLNTKLELFERYECMATELGHQQELVRQAEEIISGQQAKINKSRPPHSAPIPPCMASRDTCPSAWDVIDE